MQTAHLVPAGSPTYAGFMTASVARSVREWFHTTTDQDVCQAIPATFLIQSDLTM